VSVLTMQVPWRSTLEDFVLLRKAFLLCLIFNLLVLCFAQLVEYSGSFVLVKILPADESYLSIFQPQLDLHLIHSQLLYAVAQ